MYNNISSVMAIIKGMETIENLRVLNGIVKLYVYWKISFL